MADVKLGRLARIKINDSVVGRMNTFDFNIEHEMLDRTAYGDTDMKYEAGFRKWSASIGGHYDTDDANQATLRSAADLATKMTDIQFFVDSTGHYTVDIVTDSDSYAQISRFSFSAPHNGIVSFTMEVTGSGAYKTVNID